MERFRNSIRKLWSVSPTIALNEKIFGKNKKISQTTFCCFYVNLPTVKKLLPSLSPTNEDSNHTGRLLFGTLLFGWCGRGRERRNQDPGEGGRVGTNPSERTKRRGNVVGRRWRVTGKGPKGGLIIEFLWGFRPITPFPVPDEWRQQPHRQALVRNFIIRVVRTRPREEKPRPPNQNPKQEEARRSLSRRKGREWNNN